MLAGAKHPLTSQIRSSKFIIHFTLSLSIKARLSTAERRPGQTEQGCAQGNIGGGGVTAAIQLDRTKEERRKDHCPRHLADGMIQSTDLAAQIRSLHRQLALLQAADQVFGAAWHADQHAQQIARFADDHLHPATALGLNQFRGVRRDLGPDVEIGVQPTANAREDAHAAEQEDEVLRHLEGQFVEDIGELGRPLHDLLTAHAGQFRRGAPQKREKASALAA